MPDSPFPRRHALLALPLAGAGLLRQAPIHAAAAATLLDVSYNASREFYKAPL